MDTFFAILTTMSYFLFASSSYVEDFRASLLLMKSMAEMRSKRLIIYATVTAILRQSDVPTNRFTVQQR